MSRSCPEAQLLLACARTSMDCETAERIKELLKEDLNWAYIIDKARRHFVTLLLYNSLSATCPEQVPTDVLSQLREHFKLHTRYNLYLTRELLNLLSSFNANDIQALPLKGPALAVMAYDNISLRQFADLDILIHPKDVIRALNLLYARGYKLAAPLTRIQQVAPRFSQKKDLILTNANGNVRVELHWRLTGNHFSFPIYMDKLWERLEPLKIGGATVRNLPLNDLLLFLCMHGARHGWERLEWICDIAELIRIHPDLNWKEITCQARALGSERNLALGLFLAHDLLGARLPKEILQGIAADRIVASLAAQIEEVLFRNIETPLGIAYWHDYHLRVRERLRDKIRLRIHYYGRYLRIATVPTERERDVFRLPAFLSFLYFIVRPVRLAKKYGFGFMMRLLRKRKP